MFASDVEKFASPWYESVLFFQQLSDNKILNLYTRKDLCGPSNTEKHFDKAQVLEEI